MMQFASKPRRFPQFFPWGDGTKRVQKCRSDDFEVGDADLFCVQAQPAEPDALSKTVESPGFEIDLERYTLQAGRISKMTKIPKEILDFEPNDRPTVPASAMDLFGELHLHPPDPRRETWFDVQPGTLKRVASVNCSVKSSMPRTVQSRWA